MPVYQVNGVTVDLHDSPVKPNVGLRGAGMPYFGLTRSISDRRGNRIVLDYVPPKQYQAAEVPGTSGCKVCHQNSPEFGQIRTAKLFPADVPDTGSPAWTMVFRAYPRTCLSRMIEHPRCRNPWKSMVDFS